MIFKRLRALKKVEDKLFDSIYPEDIQKLSEDHFTPIEMIKMASQFLVQKEGARVLDIGSGAGKFCIVGATCTDGHFTGVEIRKRLHSVASHIVQSRKLINIELIHSNITQIDFTEYDAFYLYNPFFENIMSLDRIDTSLEFSKSLYKDYSNCVKEKLDALPLGTRLVTYYSAYDEVPKSYRILEKVEIQKITMWEKVV